MTQPTDLLNIVQAALEDGQAKDITSLDVKSLTTLTDNMVICSGTSTRHVKSIARKLLDAAKEARFKPFAVEGEDDGEWVLIDLGEAIVHVMLPPVREFYDLEGLWSVPVECSESDSK